MTALEQAIRDAVDRGGYKWPFKFSRAGYTPEGEVPEHIYSIVLLQCAFWQALGKARRWAWGCEECGHNMLNETDFYCMSCEKYVQIKALWLLNWHRLIDHLASGKDVESFFESL